MKRYSLRDDGLEDDPKFGAWVRYEEAKCLQATIDTLERLPTSAELSASTPAMQKLARLAKEDHKLAQTLLEEFDRYRRHVGHLQTVVDQHLTTEDGVLITPGKAVKCVECGATGGTGFTCAAGIGTCSVCTARRIERLVANINRLQDTVRQAKRRADRLQAVVDKVERTADGVPIVIGMTVWVRADCCPAEELEPLRHRVDEPVRMFVTYIGSDENDEHSPGVGGTLQTPDGRPTNAVDLVDVGDCYSTKEAAEAKGGDDVDG